jgi:uncharacterized membrane protein
MASKKKSVASGAHHNLLIALATSNGTAVLLFVLRSAESMTDRYWFLLWNLFLGWLPLLFAWLLVRNLQHKLWSHWHNIGLSLLWLGFLPNSFYLMTDLIHLHQTGEVSVLYDVVMFCSFIFNGLVAGFMSLYLVHRQLRLRLSTRATTSVVGAVLLACSFALYLGRSLRWNTWDVLLHPAGILFDVSDRFMNPGQHPYAYTTTIVFFLLLGSMYMVIWQLIATVRQQKQ